MLSPWNLFLSFKQVQFRTIFYSPWSFIFISRLQFLITFKLYKVYYLFGIFLFSKYPWNEGTLQGDQRGIAHLYIVFLLPIDTKGSWKCALWVFRAHKCAFWCEFLCSLYVTSKLIFPKCGFWISWMSSLNGGLNENLSLRLGPCGRGSWGEATGQ